MELCGLSLTGDFLSGLGVGLAVANLIYIVALRLDRKKP